MEILYKFGDEKHAKIKMTLTSPNCPVAESLPKEVKEGAMQVEEIDNVDLHNAALIRETKSKANIIFSEDSNR